MDREVEAVTAGAQVQEIHDVVVWGKVGGGRLRSTVTVDGVVVPGVDQVEVREVRPEEDERLPLLDTRLFARQAYELVLTFVEDRDRDGLLWQAATQNNAIKPIRPTAKAEDLDGRPLHRDEYAASLEQEYESTESRGTTVIRDGQALAIASLLDELAGVYSGEPLGQLARRAAVHLYDKAGV